MYSSIVLFGLLASMVPAEAAIIPLDYKRNAPAAREQVLAQRSDNRTNGQRRLVRRRKNHHWDDDDAEDNDNDWEEVTTTTDYRCGGPSASPSSSSGAPSPSWSSEPSASAPPSSSSSSFSRPPEASAWDVATGGWWQNPSSAAPSSTKSYDDGMWHPETSVTPSPSASSGGDWWAPSSSAAPSSSSSAPKPEYTSEWQWVDTISGSNFFDSKYWNWWSWDDPTHGDVTYVDAGTAWDNGLVSVNEQGRAIMRVETTDKVDRGRMSVRIHGNRVWTGGMVIMDAVHMPVGCGTWPAWWQNGPNWPEGGEIDILEGVNAFTKNQVSLHTGRGCTMPNNLNDNQLGSMTTGNFDSFDCSSANTGNQGCGVHDPSTQSYGQGFNDIGGGVYVLAWQKSGITAWFHPRYNIPADITNGAPNPDSWGTPVAHFPSTSCSPYEFFYDHFNIFDTTLCGDWAGADSVWHQSGYAGQEQSCAAITGYSSCIDYVRNNGAAFKNAYWEIK